MAKRSRRLVWIGWLGLALALGHDFASPNVQQRIERLKQSRESARQKKRQVLSKLRQVRSQQRAISEQIEEVERAAEQAQRELLRIQRNLAQTERELQRAEGELKALEARYQTYRRQVWQRLIAFYKSGHSGYLGVLLDVESFADFLNRLYFLQRLAAHDQKRLTGLRQAQRDILRLRGEIWGKRERLLSLQAEQRARQGTLRRQLAQKQRLMEAINRDRRMYEQSLAELEQTEREIEAMIRRLSRPLAPALRGSGRYVRPVNGPVVSRFGMRRHPILGGSRFHNGLDLAAPYGSPIRAVDHGCVLFAGWKGGFGLTVILDHGNGIQTLYGHCSSILVSSGQTVRRGQVIARVGSTGLSTGPHLHFTVYRNGQAVNPYQVMGAAP